MSRASRVELFLSFITSEQGGFLFCFVYYMKIWEQGGKLLRNS